MTGRDALEAYVVHESDADVAEYGRRLDAYRAEVLREAATGLDAVCEQYGVLGVGDRLRRMAEQVGGGAS